MRVYVPKIFLTAPLFASKPQRQGRVIRAGDQTIQVGGESSGPEDAPPSPALDVRHARALFTLLSFRRPFDDSGIVRFTMGEFCRRYGGSYGGRYAKDLRQLIQTLSETPWIIQGEDSSDPDAFTLVDHIEVEQRLHPCCSTRGCSESLRLATYLNSVKFSRKLTEILCDPEQIHGIDLKLFASLRSKVAQSIYLYLPSRAFHHAESNPFEITLTRLLEQIGHPVPPTRKLRKKLLVQNQRSILKRLSGAMAGGGRLQLALCETVDRKDYKLRVWMAWEERKREFRAEPKGKMLEAYLSGGRSVSDYRRCMERRRPLIEYELNLLRTGRIVFDGNEAFFVNARALLGESRFQSLLAEAKGDLLEGRPVSKSPTARLIFRIMEDLKRPVR